MMRYAEESMENDPTRQAVLAALEATGELVLPLQGGSMGPDWARADAVVVRPVPAGGAGWGDVVIFDRHGRMYAHRIIFATRAWCWTKGDARWAWDRPPVKRDEMAGVVRGIVSRGSREGIEPSLLRGAWELLCALAAWPLVGLSRRPRLQQ